MEEYSSTRSRYQHIPKSWSCPQRSKNGSFFRRGLIMVLIPDWFTYVTDSSHRPTSQTHPPSDELPAAIWNVTPYVSGCEGLYNSVNEVAGSSCSVTKGSQVTPAALPASTHIWDTYRCPPLPIGSGHLYYMILLTWAWQSHLFSPHSLFIRVLSDSTTIKAISGSLACWMLRKPQLQKKKKKNRWASFTQLMFNALVIQGQKNPPTAFIAIPLLWEITSLCQNQGAFNPLKCIPVALKSCASHVRV